MTQINSIAAIADTLKQLRKDKGLTLDDMTLLSGLNRQTLIDIEKARNVKFTSVLLYADVVMAKITIA